ETFQHGETRKRAVGHTAQARSIEHPRFECTQSTRHPVVRLPRCGIESLKSDCMMPNKSEPAAKAKIGLSITFDTLLKSHNEAATELLLDALRTAAGEIQDAALESLLKRRTIAGHRQILLRLPTLPPRQRALVAANHHRLSRVVRDAILSRDDGEFT